MKKIAYIILTCEKYLQTRVLWQFQNCFKYINKKDCYYLSCKPSTLKNNNNKLLLSIYGWNTSDDYRSCPDKYIAFFKNLNLDYDWFVFIDDDTFVFPLRINKFLSNFNENQNIYIGNILTHLREMEYMSGGAGFIISKPTYLLIKEFISTSPMSSIQKKYYEQFYGDVSFGIWVKLINEKLNIGNKTETETEKKEPIRLVHSSYFNQNNHNSIEQLKTDITFHYVTTKEKFEFYNKYNQHDVHNGQIYFWDFFRYSYFLINFYRVFSMLLQKLLNIFIYKHRSLNNSQ
jgi:hypothetical protein